MNTQNSEFTIFTFVKIIKDKLKFVLLLSFIFFIALMAYLLLLKPVTYTVDLDAYSSSIESSIVQKKILALQGLINNNQFDLLANELDLDKAQAVKIKKIDAKLTEDRQLKSIKINYQTTDSLLARNLHYNLKSYLKNDSLLHKINENKVSSLKYELEKINEKLAMHESVNNTSIMILNDVSDMIKYRSQIVEDINTFKMFEYYNVKLINVNQLNLFSILMLSLFSAITLAILFVLLTTIILEIIKLS